MDAQINNESARELGPLKYMAELTGQPMSSIVNWFMILIIFVFDPLAIAMVIAANMAFANIKGVARDPKDYEVYQKKERTQKQKQKWREGYIKAEGDMRGERLIMKPIPTLPPEPLPVNVKVPDKILQGNLTKNIPKEEKPTPNPSPNSWGSPGGSRSE